MLSISGSLTFQGLPDVSATSSSFSEYLETVQDTMWSQRVCLVQNRVNEIDWEYGNAIYYDFFLLFLLEQLDR